MEVLVWRGDVLVLGLEVAACLIRIYSKAVPDRDQSTLSHSNQGTTLCLLEAAPMVLLLFEIPMSLKVNDGLGDEVGAKVVRQPFSVGKRGSCSFG